MAFRSGQVHVDHRLAGNADMHLKNFSMWIPLPGEIQLAPAFDLVATQLLLPGDLEESALARKSQRQLLCSHGPGYHEMS